MNPIGVILKTGLADGCTACCLRFISLILSIKSSSSCGFCGKACLAWTGALGAFFIGAFGAADGTWIFGALPTEVFGAAAGTEAGLE